MSVWQQGKPEGNDSDRYKPSVQVAPTITHDISVSKEGTVPPVGSPSSLPPIDSRSEEQRLIDAFNDMKLLIVTPHTYEFIYKQWYTALMRLVKPPYTEYIMTYEQNVGEARNVAIRSALERGSSHIFFLDHDNTPDTATLVRLFDAVGQGTGSLYFERNYPYLPLIYYWRPGQRSKISVAYNYPKGIVRCDAFGMGCSLWDIEVFKAIPDPWFEYEYNGEIWGTEDLAFFRKCRDYNVVLTCDTQNPTGHLSVLPIGEQHWMQEKASYLQRLEAKMNEGETDADI